jgi:hypothetical protein
MLKKQLSNKIDQELITQNLFDVLDEAFVTHHGVFLDRGTSLFETLETITAAEASIPVGGKCATLAAQVAHVIFYLEVVEDHILNKERDNVDWGEIWRRVDKVSTEEWTAYQDQLKATYQRILSLLKNFENWNDDRPIGGALAIAIHTAYHLGEIRQAMCVVKQD